jgi:ATP-dependent RNA helicase DDX20
MWSCADVLAQAKSGTGKTCAFAVPAILAVDSAAAQLDPPAPQVIVIAPTREIAVQIRQVICSIASGVSQLVCRAFIGGLPEEHDSLLLKGCHIVVASPGRLVSILGRRLIDPSSVRLLVLDEADRLVEGPFLEQCRCVPPLWGSR